MRLKKEFLNSIQYPFLHMHYSYIIHAFGMPLVRSNDDCVKSLSSNTVQNPAGIALVFYLNLNLQ